MTILQAGGPPRLLLEASPGQVQWLTGQLTQWQRAGLVTDEQATAIRDSYHATRRLALGRLLLTLGAGFVGVGLVWLVAANLDALPPAGRFAAVSAIWLVLLASGELLAARRVSPPAVGAVRLLAALGFGAVVAQGAQSLQVPAYEPALIGCWALGALVHAYVAGAVTPLLVGVATGAGWLVWQVSEQSSSTFAGVVTVAAVAVLAVAAASWHGRWLPVFAAPWREVGALLALGALFVAALPWVEPGSDLVGPLVAAVLLLAVLAAGAAAWSGRGAARWEPLAAVVVLGAVAGLLLWDTPARTDQLAAGDIAHAVIAVVLYVSLAVGVAVLGALHDSWRLTALATVALVVFTTAQSFAVFARIVEGAWLFLLLGLVFAGTGVVFDRARRELTATLGASSDGQVR